MPPANPDSNSQPIDTAEPAKQHEPILRYPPGFKLSVVIPAYNERTLIGELLRRVEAVAIPKEVIVVDDGSTDGTRDILRDMERASVRVLPQPMNRGKGAALREGFRLATGDVILVQDADLEYNPEEYPRLLQPILEGRADIVFGSRFIADGWHGGTFLQYAANKSLTKLSNLFTRLALTDMETGYKVFRREVLHELKLQSNRFGFEPEVTAKIAKRRQPPWRIVEVPISYAPRTYAEGKKIGLRDAVDAPYCVVRYGLFD
jgi:glycosyltransferase involved in cell wall biosynthesis